METQLLATKLYVPLLRPELVSRPHLIEQLTRGLHRKLTLVSAPAGFGKTTLLSTWARNCNRAVGWVTFNEIDNDLIQFWSYVIAALNKAGLDIGLAPEVVLKHSNAQIAETLLIPLLNQITENHTPVLLILDDYHTISAQTIHDSLSFFLDFLPPQIHIAIATRVDPPLLQLALLRGRGQLTELYQRDLRFTPEETDDLLNRIMDLELSPAEIKALEQRTEGWIAGLEMAAISLRGQSDKAAFVKAFSSSNRYIFDYLLEEVLRRQSMVLQQFCLQTSILNQLSGSLCDAVVAIDTAVDTQVETETPMDSQSILEHLDRNNLFIVPQDNDRCWYRYHRLFADLLRQRLERESSNLVPALHYRASKWYQEHGRIVEAVQHAIASGNYERSGYLVQELGWSIFARGELTTLLGWIAALPEEIIHTHPELRLLQAWGMAKSGQLDQVESLLQAIESHELQGEVTAIRAYVAGVRGQLPLAIKLTRLAADILPEDNYSLRAIIAQNLGTAYHWNGDAIAANRNLTDAVRLSQIAGQTHQCLTSMAILGRTYEMQGYQLLAADTYRRALDLIPEQSDRPIPFAGMAYVGLAGPLYELNNLEQATTCALEGIRLSELGGFAAYQIAGYTRLSEIYKAQGDNDNAWRMLRQAEQLASGLNYGLVKSLMDNMRVRLWLARGDITLATQWAQTHQLDPGSVPNAAQEIESMAVARVLITLGKRGEVWSLLNWLKEAAQTSGRKDSIIKIMVLQALMVWSKNSHNDALTILEEALRLAEPEGYIRTFVDEGKVMRSLLRDALSRNIKSNYTAKLLAAFSELEQDISNAGASMTESLTDREMDVFRRMLAGLSNLEIADELFIAQSTVKSHVNHIYGKLGISHRSELLVRARELCLL